MSSADLEEWRKLLAMATRPSVRSQIEFIIKNLDSTVGATNGSRKESQVRPPRPKIPQHPQVFYNTISSFSWDQSSKYVTLLIPASEEVKEVVVDSEPNSVDIKFSQGSKHYQLRLRRLYSTIVREGVSWKYKSRYLQVKMEKVPCPIHNSQERELNWLSLTSSAEKEKKSPLPKTDDSNPQAMLMDMMKNLYNEGDDDMKRTIAKAWTEAMDKRGEVKF